MMRSRLSIFAGILLIINATEFAHTQSLNPDESIPQTENVSPKAQAWHKRGEAIVNYPMCYQLWQCRSDAAVFAEANNQTVLPVGTWGLCENYLTVQQGIPQCNQCAAIQPEIPCS